MNILFLNQNTAEPISGGVQCVSYYLYRYLKGKGHQITMLAWKKTMEMEDNDYIYLPDLLPICSKNNRDFFCYLLKERKIQVIINHTCLDPNCSLLLKGVRQKGIKIISVFHNSPFGMYGITKYARFSMLKSLFLKRMINRALLIAFRIKWGHRLGLEAEYSDKMVMLSDKFIPQFLWFAGEKYKDRMTAIPNPVTVEDLPRIKKENIVLFVGRLSPEKGLGFLMRIWKKVENRFPQWRLIIVGDGPERKTIERCINKFGILRCSLEGFQKPEPYYNRAKIFCMTSLFEGFGLVLVEAMHYGVVPMAFNSYANASDIIEDSKSGYLISPFDINAYAERLAWLMIHEDERQNMSLAAEQKSKEFSMNRIGGKWDKLIGDLIRAK
jgi:glycosyltransferase involved in cell wall biosynthesis